MADRNQGTARPDIMIYENTSSYPQKKRGDAPERQPEIRKITSRKGSASKIFVSAMLIVGFLTYVIYGKAETNKMYSEVLRAGEQLETLDSENKRMKTEIESQMAMKNVEEYAEVTLGLKKLSKSQIEYIQVQSGAVVEIPEEETNFFINIKKKFDSFMEYIFN